MENHEEDKHNRFCLGCLIVVLVLSFWIGYKRIFPDPPSPDAAIQEAAQSPAYAEGFRAGVQFVDDSYSAKYKSDLIGIDRQVLDEMAESQKSKGDEYVQAYVKGFQAGSDQSIRARKESAARINRRDDIPSSQEPRNTQSPSVRPEKTPSLSQLETAKNLAVSKDYKQASMMLVKILEKDAKNEEANFWLFVCLKHLSQESDEYTEVSIKVAKRVLALSPGTPWAKQAQDFIGSARQGQEVAKVQKGESDKNAQADAIAQETLEKCGKQLSRIEDSAFDYIKSNNDFIKSEYSEGHFENCIRFLFANLGRLEVEEQRWTTSTAASLHDANLDDATENAIILRRIKLAQVETQFALGVVYWRTGQATESKRFMILASQDKGLGDEWEGKREYLEIRQMAKRRI